MGETTQHQGKSAHSSGVEGLWKVERARGSQARQGSDRQTRTLNWEARSAKLVSDKPTGPVG